MNATQLRAYLDHVLALATPAVELLPARYRTEAREGLQVLRQIIDDSEVLDGILELLHKKGVA